MPQGKIVLLGNGFALPFWKRRLDAEGLEYKQVDAHFAGELGDEPADVLIETEELPPPPEEHFHEPHDEGEDELQREDPAHLPSRCAPAATSSLGEMKLMSYGM